MLKMVRTSIMEEEIKISAYALWDTLACKLATQVQLGGCSQIYLYASIASVQS